MPNDLPDKLEAALRVFLLAGAHIPAKKRVRSSREDSPKVNGDVVIAATLGTQNPPYSGVFDLDITVTFEKRTQAKDATLTEFTSGCAAIEARLNVEPLELGQLLTGAAATSSFHCYECALIGSSDNTEDNKHSCTWQLTAIAMGVKFKDAKQ